MELYLPQCLVGMVVEYLVPPIESAGINCRCWLYHTSDADSYEVFRKMNYNKYQVHSLITVSEIGECCYCKACKKVYILTESGTWESCRRGTIDAIEYAGKIFVGTPTFRNISEFLDMSEYVKYHWSFIDR